MLYSAYLYQTINLLVVILMVPLILRYLDVSRYVLWSIFTTFGGITLQLESAIQIVSVREIAKEYHSGNVASLQNAIQKAKVNYMILSACVLVPFLVLGLLYLNYVVSEKLGNTGNIEWLIFISAYALNYYFAINNSILLSMVYVTRYNNINTLTRCINFICTYLLLKLGFSVMGLSLSFAFSVVISVALMSRAAKKCLDNYYASQAAHIQSNTKYEYANSSTSVKYTFYMFSSFVLYKGGFLIATMIFPKDIIGAYGLTLQANTVLSTFALVLPSQVWLHRLVRAVTSGNRQKMFHVFALGAVAANTIFIAGVILLALFGNKLLVLIHSKVMFVGNMNLLLICFAFLVELNIFLLVNFLVVMRNYKFIKIYVSTSLISAVFAFLLTWATQSSIATLIIVPLGLQVFLSLPLIFRVTSHELAITPKVFLSQLSRFIWLSK